MIVNEPPSTHDYTPVKVALMSGASNPRSCGLSAVQYQFLDGLDLPSSSKIYMNFPYLPAYRHADGQPPLWLASWRNLNQFLGASRRAYQESAALHLQTLLNSCDRLLIVTLSCGLEILNSCLAVLGTVDSLHVLSLGPVAWGRPPVPHVLVQGTRDYISQSFFRQVETRLSHVGHMDYLEQASVHDLVNDYLSQHVCGSTSGY